jgi:hypothetical protein
MRSAATDIRAHLLPFGDAAGSEPALFALHGVNLTLEPDVRPTTWEHGLDSGVGLEQDDLRQTDAGARLHPGRPRVFYKNIELNWPMGAFLDVEAVVRAYAWMRANADIIVPHHDWGFFDRHPSGIVGVPPASSEWPVFGLASSLIAAPRQLQRPMWSTSSTTLR